jgi:hypothetical protein
MRDISEIDAHSCGGVATSGGDGMDSSTQVPVVKCTWLHVAMSSCVRHLMSLFPEDPAPVALPGTEKALGMYRVGSHRGSTVDKQMVKSCLSVAIVTG